jgi:hypothetical protein
MERSASPRSGPFDFCLARLSNPLARAKTLNHFSGAWSSKDSCKTQIRVGPLVSNTQRPQGRESAPCQDTLKAFLVERRMGGLFYHCQLARHLARAGFEVRHVERESNHAHVWVLKIRRGQVPAGREIDWTKRTGLVFLKRHGLRYPKKEVVVMVQGDRIKAAFNWGLGEPGWLTMQRGNGQQKTRSRS